MCVFDCYTDVFMFSWWYCQLCYTVHCKCICLVWYVQINWTRTVLDSWEQDYITVPVFNLYIIYRYPTTPIHGWLFGWARFNVPLDTVSVILETMFLQVRWPNQQCQSTEGGWLVIQIALNLTRLISPCYSNTTCMHIQDNDTQRNLSTVSEPSEMKQNLVD